MDEQRHQKDEGDHVAQGHAPPTAEHRAESDNGGHRRRTEEVRHREDGGHVFRASHLRLVSTLDGLLQLPVRPVLQAVGAHHRGPHEALRDGGQRFADPRPHLVVRRQHASLHESQDHEQREDGQQRQQGELPRVDEHHQAGSEHQGGARDPRDPAPFQELAERVDVRGHPRHECPSLLGGLFGDRQPVDMGEGTHPERRQSGLAGPDQSAVGRPPGEVHEYDQDGGDHAGRVHEPRPESLRTDQAAVEDLLDEDGDEHPDGGEGHGQANRVAEAGAQLGRLAEPAAEQGHRALDVFGRDELLFRRHAARAFEIPVPPAEVLSPVGSVGRHEFLRSGLILAAPPWTGPLERSFESRLRVPGHVSPAHTAARS